jgi:hypothetical protein
MSQRPRRETILWECYWRIFGRKDRSGNGHKIVRRTKARCFSCGRIAYKLGNNGSQRQHKVLDSAGHYTFTEQSNVDGCINCEAVENTVEFITVQDHLSTLRTRNYKKSKCRREGKSPKDPWKIDLDALGNHEKGV